VTYPTFVSLVVYMRDEASVIRGFVDDADSWLRAHFETFEIILVNDGSRDETSAAAHAAAAACAGAVSVLDLARPCGVEAAMLAGLDRAVGDFIFELDTARIDFGLQFLEELYVTATSGFDIVGGSRAATSLRSRLFYRIVNRYSDLELDLTTERVRVVSRRALNAMLALQDKVRYRKALYSITGYPQTRVLYRSLQSAAPDRKLDRETASLAFDILLSFSNFGLALAHRLSLFFLLFSLLAAAYALATHFVLSHVVEGWTTVVVFMSFGFAGVFGVLGIVAEYAARILIEVRARPPYALKGARLYPSVALPPDESRLGSPTWLRQATEPLPGFGSAAPAADPAEVDLTEARAITPLGERTPPGEKGGR